MADDSSTRQSEREAELDSEIEQLVTAINLDTNSAAHLSMDELEAEVDNEIERLIAGARFDMDNNANTQSFGSPTTADASFESAHSTGEGSIESDSGFTPSNSADTFRPRGSQTAAYPTTGSMGIMEGMGSMGDIEAPVTISSRFISISTSGSSTLGSNSTTDASLEFLESLQIVQISDLPEHFTTCPICKEAFENTEHSEVPVRLPCRHIFGKLCISKWISNKTCPLCRAVLLRPTASDALARHGEAGEPPIPTPPALRQPFWTSAPLVLLHTVGAERENVRRIDVEIRELADERRELIEDRASFGAQSGMSSRSQGNEEILAKIEECLRSNARLLNRLSDIRIYYNSRI